MMVYMLVCMQNRYIRTVLINLNCAVTNLNWRLKNLTKYERVSLISTLNYPNKTGLRNYQSARDTCRCIFVCVHEVHWRYIFKLRNICILFINFRQLIFLTPILFLKRLYSYSYTWNWKNPTNLGLVYCMSHSTQVILNWHYFFYWEYNVKLLS